MRNHNGSDECWQIRYETKYGINGGGTKICPHIDDEVVHWHLTTQLWLLQMLPRDIFVSIYPWNFHGANTNHVYRSKFCLASVVYVTRLDGGIADWSLDCRLLRTSYDTRTDIFHSHSFYFFFGACWCCCVHSPNFARFVSGSAIYLIYQKRSSEQQQQQHQHHNIEYCVSVLYMFRNWEPPIMDHPKYKSCWAHICYGQHEPNLQSTCIYKRDMNCE